MRCSRSSRTRADRIALTDELRRDRNLRSAGVLQEEWPESSGKAAVRRSDPRGLAAQQLVGAIERTVGGESPMAPQVLTRLVERFLAREPAGRPEPAE